MIRVQPYVRSCFSWTDRIPVESNYKRDFILGLYYEDPLVTIDAGSDKCLDTASNSEVKGPKGKGREQEYDSSKDETFLTLLRNRGWPSPTTPPRLGYGV